jgi:RNA polymerase sigma-70 factor (ECF subfamily)
MLRDAELARDATQETALRFLRQLDGFRGESQLRTWSLSIAVNVVREMRRKRGAMSAGDDLDLDQLAPERSSGNSPDRLEQQESRDLLRATLHELPDRQREVITLRFFEELSTEQTATAMGCAVGTVKATLHQALRALKTRMTQPKRA